MIVWTFLIFSLIIQSKLIFILFILSMGQICGCLTNNFDQDIFDYQQRNIYLGSAKQKQKMETILKAITNDHNNPNYLQLASYISNQRRLQFSDPYYTKMQSNEGSSSLSLQKMYDFKRKKLEKVYLKKNTPLHIFDQKEVELSYLASIFYAICSNRQLKQRIFVTQNINPYFVYIVQLFCQGKPTNVVIDDKIPVQDKNIKYLRLRQTQQIWPFLLEKAWSKQVGSYNQALGLSPEDCFQQLTGIPADTFPLMNNFNIIKEAKRQNYWVVLIAKRFQMNEKQGVKSRQVFYVQQIHEQSNSVLIRSPHLDFQLAKVQKSKDGLIQLSQIECMRLFQYYTIGFYTPGFVLQSYEHFSQKNKQVIYELKLKKREKINLRFIQSYFKYSPKAQIFEVFQYSPVFMQLYDERYNLIRDCEGRPENMTGCRSSKISNFAFTQLNEGVYYLRIFIDWSYEKQIQSGTLVLYNAPETSTLTKIQGKDFVFMPHLINTIIQMSQVVKDTSEQQQLKVRYVEKSNGYIIGIQNLTKTSANLKLILKESENVRINYHTLIDKTLSFNLNGSQKIIFQVLPQDPRKQYHLSSIDVVRSQI